jgi:hypothetical protein
MQPKAQMFWWFLFSYNGSFSWLMIKNIMKCPLPQVKIKLFTIIYSYIILNDCVKSYKYIFFTFTLFYMIM